MLRLDSLSHSALDDCTVYSHSIVDGGFELMS